MVMVLVVVGRGDCNGDCRDFGVVSVVRYPLIVLRTIIWP
jgi:hypothetical protein